MHVLYDEINNENFNASRMLKSEKFVEIKSQLIIM